MIRKNELIFKLQQIENLAKCLKMSDRLSSFELHMVENIFLHLNEIEKLIDNKYRLSYFDMTEFQKHTIRSL